MKRMILVPFATLAAAAPAEDGMDAPAPVILQAQVEAPPEEVWRALTTQEGVTSFFGPAANLDPRLDGAYEIYFLLQNPPGLRGSEGARVLAMEPPSRLLISWNAPTTFGPLRDQRTVVEFLLTRLGRGSTLLTTTHSGWGRSVSWRKVRDYFAGAWPVVLGRLQHRFAIGPVDWRNPPDGGAFFRPAYHTATKSVD